MSTIFVFFALPIGLILYFWDKKNVAEADRLFDAFIEEVKANTTLSAGEKLRHIDNMFYENGFKTVEVGDNHLITEKKTSEPRRTHYHVRTAELYRGVRVYRVLFLLA